MSRSSRLVIPGLPHHGVTRGSRRQTLFYCDQDFLLYMRLLKKFCSQCGVRILAYCLMTNHLHLLLVPETSESLGQALKLTHQAYSLIINAREGFSGALFKGRFWSRPVQSDREALAVARYIERNPMGVLVDRAEDWPYSSAAAHLRGEDDEFVEVAPLLRLVNHWSDVLLNTWPSDDEYSYVEPHRGRPRKAA